MRNSVRVIGLSLVFCLLLSACGQQSVLMDSTQPTVLTEATTLPPEPETVPSPLPEETQPPEEEPEVPATEPKDELFVAVEEYLPDVSVELKYASEENFTGQRIYDFDTCYLRYGTVKKLMAVQEALRERGLSLKLWDGFRPVSAQFALWEVCLDPTYVANPETGYSAHSRGNTVDVTVVDEAGREVQMPTGFDDFSSLADRDYSDCTAEAAENALLLQRVMEQQGFKPYFGEWWHFSDTVQYDVETVFDPALVSQWYAQCNEFISLRVSPDTRAAVITRIPVGDTFTLLGYTGEFSMVNYRGQTGYVLTSYTRPVPRRDETAVPNLWTPNCEEFITLRKNTAGDFMDQIPLGEKFVLLDWEGEYAMVDYRGQRGYVLSSYIQPAGEGYFADCLDTVAPTATYTYEQMMKDAKVFASAYPGSVTVDSIGTSELGRGIPVLRIGDPEAEHQVLLQGAIHGREHMTAWLLMAMVDYWMEHGFDEHPDICFHIIPMSNPDGVTVSQTGNLTDYQNSLYSADLHAGYTKESMAEYAAQWKANGLGVDLNRNFPAGWENVDDRTVPSAMLYRGERPFGAAETAALRDYTLAYEFDATLSYHASGCVIFWEYGSRQPVNDMSHSLAKELQAVSGYPPQGSESVDGAGYKDWVMEELGIPSVTVEIGTSAAPLQERELYAAFARNAGVLAAVAQWLEE